MKSRSHHNRVPNSDPPDDWVNGSWTVDCVCGVNYDDGEEMVNCDECGVWVHTRCSHYVKSDDAFACDKCKAKKRRNDSAETEVAQLLVELPTKSVRIESRAYRRPPFRLWSEIPIEERVHVQGKPGGMLAGLSSVFTPELWKCTGYVPKKFNFRYKEFPCWDDDEKKLDDENENENENPVDKGAGVLFSLSKERVVGEAENGSKKENGLLRSVMLHVGKRKKEDYGIISKDRSGRKKAKASEKDSDAKKSSSKTVFTPTSVAKHLAFHEDKFHRDEVQSTKNKRPRETEVNEPTSDNHLDKPKIHLKEIASAAPECSPETNIAVCLVSNLDTTGKLHVKDEEDGQSVSKTNGNSIVKDVPGIVEAKQNKVRDSNSDLVLKSEHPNTEVKVEDLDKSSGSLLNVQYSVPGNAKDPGTSSDQMSDIPKVNGVTSTTSQPLDHKAEDFYQSSEAASESHVNRAGRLADDLSLLRSELEGTEGLMALHKSPRARNYEEHAKPGGTVTNFNALSGQRKMVACTGKTSTTTLTPKSSTSEQFKSANNRNPFAKSQNRHDSNVNVRIDRASHDDFRDENQRRSVKERPKSVGNPIPKPSNSSRITHDSLSRKSASEAKEVVLSASSKSSSPSNSTILYGSGEPAVQLHHQRATTHSHNRSLASGLSQKCEKPSQPSLQASPKMNQNHVPSVCPPAALSDEELALLLHQELNSSPRVPRVPRMRNVGTSPQQASSTPTSLLMKRTSSSLGKDHSMIPKRKYKDAARDGFREGADEPKRMERVFSSRDPKRRDTEYRTEATSKEDGESAAMESGKKNGPSTSNLTNSDPSSSNEANDCNLSPIRSSPRNISDDDTGTVHQTLPALINDIMAKGNRMTYDELCNTVLPHWQNLRKHNGERYAYTSHSQAVLDCLRNRHEWANLVDRGPKINLSKKRRKNDAEDSEDNDHGKGKAGKREKKSLESQKEDFPKGKRKARKRRRLALQGKGIQDTRKTRKRDRLTDKDYGTSSDSSEASSAYSDDETQGSEASSSSREEISVKDR